MERIITGGLAKVVDFRYVSAMLDLLTQINANLGRIAEALQAQSQIRPFTERGDYLEGKIKNGVDKGSGE